MMSLIEKYLKLLPLATLVLIIASSTKLATYYRVFNINISEYLSITEYIPLFIDDLHALIYPIVIFLFGFTVGEAINKKEQTKAEEKSNVEKDNKKSRYRMRYFFLILMGILLIVFPITLYYNYEYVSERLENTVGLLVVLMFLVFMVSTTYKKVGRSFLALWIVIFVFAPLITIGYKEAYLILDNREPNVYQIKFKGGKTELSSSFKFLGSSEKYIFLYDLNNQESIVRPMSDVNEIRIRNR